MAKVISPVWSQIAGSIGGTTYQVGHKHSIIARSKPAPPTPTSTNQLLLQQAFGEASAQWTSLSTADRRGWENFSVKRHNAGLSPYRFTGGRYAFISGWSFARYLNLRFGAAPAPVDTPPDNEFFTALVFLGTTPPPAGNTGFIYTVQNIGTRRCTMFIQNSGVMSPTRNYFRGPYPNGNQVYDMMPGQIRSFTATGLTVGDTYFYRARAVGRSRNDISIQLSWRSEAVAA